MSELELIKAQVETIKTQRELIDYLKAEMERLKGVVMAPTQIIHNTPFHSNTPFIGAPSIISHTPPCTVPFQVTFSNSGSTTTSAKDGLPLTKASFSEVK